MPRVDIDGIRLDAAEGATILQAAERAGLAIPHLCYHPALGPEGSCRLCLVEVEGSPKLELACATVVRDGMRVRTGSPQVREARKSVLEFLLAEHSLDCPICDKAGECLLQDYYQRYGQTEGVFAEAKDRREKKLRIGDTLLLDRERCVLCTRCVRFLAEVTKTGELGVVERGSRSEISTYDGERVRSLYAGNLVDLCPTGAITDLTFRFKTRTWFLDPRAAVCPQCGRGCNIFIDVRRDFPRVSDSETVYRIRPRLNEAVNGPWICDHGRYDYLEALRPAAPPKIVWNRETRGVELSWDKAIGLLAAKIRSGLETKGPERIALVLTTFLTNEELYLIKKIFQDSLGLGKIYFADPPPGPADGFLLTAERSPNRNGAEVLGFDLRPPILGELVQSTDVLLLFGAHLARSFNQDVIGRAFDKVQTKVLIGSDLEALAARADFVFPATPAAGKDGSFVNIGGRLQRFVAAVRPRGDERPEFEILTELGRALGLGAASGEEDGVSGVFQRMVSEFPAFGGSR
jgi:NADH-quinone oxidoreductase subunit G